METKVEIKSIWGSILFTHECEGNSVKKPYQRLLEEVLT